MPGRILALDYGTKRIGVALSDELWWTARPLETFERRTLDRDVAHVARLVVSHEVERVVLGLPLQLDGREGPAVQSMREFVVKLEAALSVPLVLWDERMTTKAAEDFLIAADVSRKKRKGAVDRVAASLLLQGYLASLTAATEDSAITDATGERSRSECSSEIPHEASSFTDPSHFGHRRRDRRDGPVSDDPLG
ncbi:Holliday junction resolvase RuvX [Candidatus Nitrospira inopinata]|jgi:putative Holliday junction resolvase|uniref:Putative pre-16S rRNA nuclease n=1 Tax=Candidatus Nitrospira inopinata TaxID=1715989 RepID=A0A0S4KWF3_9BACT|nr:Holliday junction resolvase RuvX [Candidatus Nitrospira inopinata]CUQ67502.1 Putative Holliday junction resolvase (modular protein) [Candidatus Nitrospira inopinata]